MKTTITKISVYTAIMFLFFLSISCNSKVQCPFCHGTKVLYYNDGTSEACLTCDEDGMIEKDKLEDILDYVRNNTQSSETNSTTTKGNCGACNGRGYIDTSHGRESCTVCGGDGDFSFQDGNENMNTMHELENRHYDNSSSSTTSGNRCEHCRGTGYCATCNGSGVSFTTEYAANDYTTCPVCKGHKLCRFCGGKGVR